MTKEEVQAYLAKCPCSVCVERRNEEAGCFIITKHHDGSYSFGTSGMDSDSVRHGLNLVIYSLFIFEEMERRGQEH